MSLKYEIRWQPLDGFELFSSANQLSMIKEVLSLTLKSETRNSKPYAQTLNPKPETRNPKLLTLNP